MNDVRRVNSIILTQRTTAHFSVGITVGLWRVCGPENLGKPKRMSVCGAQKS